jgi:hypothetical protein
MIISEGTAVLPNHGSGSIKKKYLNGNYKERTMATKSTKKSPKRCRVKFTFNADEATSCRAIAFSWG